MIAKGVRFNAVQRYVGDYFSTKIWEFYMKCPHCPMRIASRTDPEKCDYIYKEGAYRIWQVDDCTEQDRIRDEEKQQKISDDPFFKLENEKVDKEENEMNLMMVEKLEELQKRGLSDFEMNRELRKRMKERKEEIEEKNSEMRAMNLSIPLAELTEKDKVKL